MSVKLPPSPTLLYENQTSVKNEQLFCNKVFNICNSILFPGDWFFCRKAGPLTLPYRLQTGAENLQLNTFPDKTVFPWGEGLYFLHESTYTLLS